MRTNVGTTDHAPDTQRTKRLRIVVCLSQFSPTIGGAERQLEQLAACWTAQGHSVSVLTRPVAGQPQVGELHGTLIYRVIRTLSVGPLFGLTFIASLVLHLLRRSQRSDVVLAGQAPWEAVATGLYGTLTGKPTVVRIANAGPFGDLGQLNRAKGHRLLAWLVCRNARFLALSQQSVQELSRLGCSDNRIVRITNGVDTQHFLPATEPHEQASQTVLFAGRLCAQKDPITLLRAWHQLNRHAAYRLLVAGTGPLEHEMQQLVAELDLKNVQLLGLQRDMQSVYHRAAVLVLPSLSEGCSNALLEAMSAGLCPVVSAIGGNRDVITDGVNGRLVPPGDADGLCAALADVLTDGRKRTRLSNAARDYVVAQHDINIIAQTYLATFSELVG